MYCRWLLTSSIFWVAVISFCFNVFTNLRAWPIEDPMLLTANSIFIIAMFGAIMYTIVVFLWRCICGKSRRAKFVILRTDNDGNDDALPEFLTAEDWSNNFDLLGDRLPQERFEKSSHDNDCNCACVCQHLVARCRVLVKTDVVKGAPKTYFKRVTLTHHVADCQCRCFGAK